MKMESSPLTAETVAGKHPQRRGTVPSFHPLGFLFHPLGFEWLSRTLPYTEAYGGDLSV